MNQDKSMNTRPFMFLVHPDHEKHKWQIAVLTGKDKPVAIEDCPITGCRKVIKE